MPETETAEQTGGWLRTTFHRNEITAEDLDRMTSALFFEGMKQRTKTSAFWILLVLSGIIATAGVANDSTATVIGAMIVAPLMTPILGAALAIILTDRRMLAKSALFIIGGAVIVIAIGWFFGQFELLNSSVVGNSQVASRINPNIIDLFAALATGLVGAFALVRSDVSDTLPGVAIAISLVPPLAVCGLVLNDSDLSNAAGAFLLFATNVSAIIATGCLTLWYYKVRDRAQAEGRTLRRLSAQTVLTIIASIVIVAIPLFAGTQEIVREHRIRTQAEPIANTWAEAAGWDVVEISVDDGVLTIAALGSPPRVDPQVLREALNQAGLGEVDLDIRLLLGGEQRLAGTSAP